MNDIANTTIKQSDGSETVMGGVWEGKENNSILRSSGVSWVNNSVFTPLVVG